MFDPLIHEISHSPRGRNTLGDGTRRVTYSELPRIFTALDEFFREQYPGAVDCLVLRCANSLPEAVVLLWLLARGGDFLILPRPARGTQKEFEDSRLPGFFSHVISVDSEAPGLDLDIPASYLRVGENSRHMVESRPEQGNPGVFLRTSGSTASPKLVLFDREKLYNNALACVDRFGLTGKERVLVPVPIYHMYGLGAGFLPSVIAGASINLLGNTNIVNYMDRERRFLPTKAFLTPPLIDMMLRARKSSYRYRLSVTAGARINESAYVTFERSFGPLVNLYGSTELGAIATSDPEDPLEVRSRGCLKAMPGVDIRLGDGATGSNPGGKEAVMEIFCRHSSGFSTYLDQRGNALETGRDGWFATRDLGKLLGENRFKVMDRLGHSINRSGILVAFSEVESILEEQVEGVLTALVTTGKEQGDRGNLLVAFCEPEKDANLDEKEIRSRCFEVMMRHLVPDRVVLIDELPRLPNGKVDRQRITEMVK